MDMVQNWIGIPMNARMMGVEPVPRPPITRLVTRFADGPFCVDNVILSVEETDRLGAYALGKTWKRVHWWHPFTSLPAFRLCSIASRTMTTWMCMVKYNRLPVHLPREIALLIAQWYVNTHTDTLKRVLSAPHCQLDVAVAQTDTFTFEQATPQELDGHTVRYAGTHARRLFNNCLAPTMWVSSPSAVDAMSSSYIPTSSIEI